MTRIVVRSLVLSPLMMILCVGILYAQPNFVYANNDVRGPNTVSGFSVNDEGMLKKVKGSPFLTGGTGSGEGFFAANRIVTSAPGSLVFVSNAASNDISVFSINPDTGRLTLVPGSPFLVASRFSVQQAITLAVSNDGRFLFAAGTDGCEVTVFTVAVSGVLSTVQGSPFKGCAGLNTVQGIGGMKVTPNGRFLAVSGTNDLKISIFTISDDGSITVIPSPPQFPFGVSSPTRIEFNCAGDFLFATDSGGGAKVHSFTLGSNGDLRMNPGSPFKLTDTLTGDGLALTPNNRFLFVSNQFIPRITAFSVLPNGSLEEIAGSPFNVPRVFDSVGMATDRQGRFLYVANSQSDSISVFQIMGDGRLIPVPETPFLTGQIGTLESLVAYPPPRPACLTIKITEARVEGKKLLVFGKDFDDGSVILLNGTKQKTANDENNPTVALIAKKSGKKIEPGQTVKLQVRNSDGYLSPEFEFTRP